MIQVYNCSKLKTINSHAFRKTDQVSTRIYIGYCPALTSPDNSIFEVLSKFVHATSINLVHNNVTEIQSNAFQNIVGKQDHLTELWLSGHSLRKLGNNSFSQLNNLDTLHITETSINFIPESAFDFNVGTKHEMTIYLYGNRALNSSGSSDHALTKMKRPTTINLDSSSETRFHFLDEKIFQPFFKSNAKNQIELREGSLDCSDCRNYWLKKNPTLLKQIENHNLIQTVEARSENL